MLLNPKKPTLERERQMEYRFSTTIANIALDLNHLDTIYRILNVRELPLPDYIDTSDKEVIIKHIRNVFKAYEKSEKLIGNKTYAALSEPIVDEVFPVTAKLER